ncbi:MAG: IS30 family transposase [Armatimonadetes bacterium]|nr:IS30 family transposase [Candidatus Hippobium faecium]
MAISSSVIKPFITRSIKICQTFQKKKTKRRNLKDIYDIKENQDIKKELLTVTPDNGKEFAYYKKAENEFGITFYIADPGCPGQIGTNENTNGLLKEFIPKGTEINNITNELLQKYVNLINNRPRKILKYQKPADIFGVD